MSQPEDTEKRLLLSDLTVERTADSVMWIDYEARFVRVNEATCHLLGYSRDELRSMTVRDVLVDYTEERWRKYFAKLKQKKKHFFEADHRRKDGQAVPVSVTNSLIEFDGKEYVCSFIRDITKRKKAEKELEESRRSLLEAQQVAHLGIWEWDIAANVVTWSDELYKIYGLTPQEFKASYEGFLERVHPDDRERVNGLVDSAYQNQTPLDFYHRVVCPDGSVRTLHGRGEIVTDQQGSAIRIVGTALDVSAIKEAEEEIRNLNAELEQRVRERTAELEATLRQLQETQNQLILREKMASLGNLVAGVAHEINNPTGAVRSASDVSNRCLDRLEEVITQGDSTGSIVGNLRFQTAIKLLRENVQITVEGSERIAEIVRSLRIFARLDKSELDKADIHEGLESTLTLLHHELKHKVEVIREYGKIPRIYCYAQELNQVFMNVLANAIQAIENKGTIRIKTSADRKNVYVEIADTGKGIPPDKLARIFDPGFTTKGVGVGTGLGLSISHNIIQKHDGEIRVKSELGKGTTFTAVLPNDLDKSTGKR